MPLNFQRDTSPYLLGMHVEKDASTLDMSREHC